MSTVDTSTELSVEHLLNSVKQLSPVELNEFTQKLTEWQQEQKIPIGENVDPDASDDEVLAFIKKNTRLPEKENLRYWELRLKREDIDLCHDETVEYEDFLTKLGEMSVKRLEALAILVHRWEKPASEILSEHGLHISHCDELDYYESISQVIHSETKRQE